MLGKRSKLLKKPEYLSVAADPGRVLAESMTVESSTSAKIGLALKDKFIPDQADFPGVGRGFQMYRARGNRPIDAGSDYFSVLTWDKNNLSGLCYRRCLVLLARLLVDSNGNYGPASMLNTGDFVREIDIQQVHILGNQNKILRKFGGFKVKEDISTAVLNSIGWLEEKSKELSGVDIPELVIKKKKIKS